MPIEFTVPDRDTAEKFCDAVAELVGERPVPVKVYAVHHPGVTQTEAFAILAMIQHLRKNYIYRETIRGIANGKILAWAVRLFHSNRDIHPDSARESALFDHGLFSSNSARPSEAAASLDQETADSAMNAVRNGRRARSQRPPRRTL